MAGKNYYLILGISSTATESDIKNAYRRLAKSYHPDLYGSNHNPFLDIQEAYSVLSDPVSRRRYDESTGKSRLTAKRPARHKPPHRTVEPLIPEQKQAEPLIKENRGLKGRSYHKTAGTRFWFDISDL